MIGNSSDEGSLGTRAHADRESTADSSQRTLWLSSHVHVCNTLDGCVLLDLRRDKYLGFGRDETELLAFAVHEWPVLPWTRREATVDDITRGKALCDSLLTDNLISKTRPLDSLVRRAQSMSMHLEWVSIGDELEAPDAMTVRDIANFLMAFAAAWSSLKFGHIEKTVESVRRVRHRAQLHRRPSVAGDGNEQDQLPRMIRAVGAFRRLRTFVFAVEGRCLLHALTLIKFLGRDGLHPDWVIGVSTQPWGAHSWVQWQRYLLDTTPEKIGKYLPILAV
jgi:Transglutaminase-like superfamily